MIQKLGIQGIEEAKKRVQRSAKALNVTLILVLGGFIAYLLVATVITAQGLSDALQEEITQSATAKRH